jgi:ribosomal silencing factor RsfS
VKKKTNNKQQNEQTEEKMLPVFLFRHSARSPSALFTSARPFAHLQLNRFAASTPTTPKKVNVRSRTTVRVTKTKKDVDTTKTKATKSSKSKKAKEEMQQKKNIIQLSEVMALLDEEKALRPLVFDTSTKCNWLNYMVIAEGTSGRHLSSIGERLLKEVQTNEQKKKKQKWREHFLYFSLLDTEKQKSSKQGSK